MADTTAHRPRCMNLCCKSMLVYGERFQNDPEFQQQASNFWCVLTAKGLGPDGDFVDLEACSDPQRSCFKEY